VPITLGHSSHRRIALRCAVVGHVDAGKTSLIGRLAYQCRLIDSKHYDECDIQLATPSLRWNTWSNVAMKCCRQTSSLAASLPSYRHTSTPPVALQMDTNNYRMTLYDTQWDVQQRINVANNNGEHSFVMVD
jgi:GTPase SAR1 family protein